jgi:hypothetical protein
MKGFFGDGGPTVKISPSSSALTDTVPMFGSAVVPDPPPVIPFHEGKP